MSPRLRVACYVTRERAERIELLVFDHVDFLEAGRQVPAGGIEAGETYAEAAVREVREETGLTGAKVVRVVGESDRPHPETGEPRRTTYVHLRTTAESPERWIHVVTGAGDDAELRFACFWAALPVQLADQQHELLGRLDL
ncbi:MAG TPA: NUDIX domain-containing protein [Nocardioidaceae bacterium]|nr:NUDIX domain-containing protein [Nocardioidaceae bacterium]